MKCGSAGRLAPTQDGEHNGGDGNNAHRPDYCGILVIRQMRLHLPEGMHLLDLLDQLFFPVHPITVQAQSSYCGRRSRVLHHPVDKVDTLERQLCVNPNTLLVSRNQHGNGKARQHLGSGQRRRGLISGTGKRIASWPTM